MIASRRAVRARHEFRFGGREIVALGVTGCVLGGAVFAAGVLVGRQMGGGDPAVDEPADPTGSAGGPPSAEPPAAGPGEEKLTFYRTLTAPTTDLPPVGPPRIEERLVPREEPGSPPAPAAPSRRRELPRAVPERRPPPPRPEASAPDRAPPRPEAPGPERAPVRAARPVPPPPPRPAPAPAASPPPVAGDALAWTVQVSAFRSRTLADELRARLAARGFEAYILTSASEEGRPRYRVRVGAYENRSEAERVAAELRTERGLNPLVTSRAR